LVFGIFPSLAKKNTILTILRGKNRDLLALFLYYSSSVLHRKIQISAFLKNILKFNNLLINTLHFF